MYAMTLLQPLMGTTVLPEESNVTRRWATAEHPLWARKLPARCRACPRLQEITKKRFALSGQLPCAFV
jgi:hypothetical protein